MASSTSLDSRAFYATYHGHTKPHLEKVHAAIRSVNPTHSFVYLAGDSSLDSKHWFNDTRPAVNGYEKVLRAPATMKEDISYHLNRLFEEHGVAQTVFNGAVEESTIGERLEKLFPQDEFIRDHITCDDTLVISLGGNDIALRPTLKTIWNMLLLMKMNTKLTLLQNPRSAWGIRHFIWLFRDCVKTVVEKITAKKRPKRVVVCMLYYLDERCGGWAGGTLQRLGYDKDPGKLQAAISAMFELATKDIRIDGVEVVAFPMFKVLDGKTTADYCEAVEPSAQGNRKLAESMFPILIKT